MSQAGIRPRNHPKQVAWRRSRMDGTLEDKTDDVDDRRTPRSLFDPLHARYRFTVDAAASGDNALLSRFWTKGADALRLVWTGEMVWCNPPYSAIPAWIAHGFEQVARHACLGVIMLLPADRTEQPWWQDFIEPLRDRGLGVATTFIRKRVKFGLPPDHPKSDAGLAGGKRGGGFRYPPFGCVLVHLSPELARPMQLPLLPKGPRAGKARP
jgi:phage N-6-adenine-methyltransferase